MRTEEEVTKLLNELAMDSIGIHPLAVVRDGVTIPRSEYGDGWNAFRCENSIDNPISEEWKRGADECKQRLEDNKVLFRNWYNSLENDTKEQMLNLLEDEHIFLSFKDIGVLMWVNCNDLFYWGGSDAEDITLDEIPSLIEEIKKDSAWGSNKWCCRKRKLRPQIPIVESMKKNGNWTDELESLPAPEPS